MKLNFNVKVDRRKKWKAFRRPPPFRLQSRPQEFDHPRWTACQTGNIRVSISSLVLVHSSQPDCFHRGTHAVGVEYTNDIISKPNSDQALVTAKASKLVVVSAGAFGSPTILERSGIGAKKVLEAAGVQQLVELPGVGENYQGKIYLLSTTYHNLFIRNPRPQCGLCPIPCGW